MAHRYFALTTVALAGLGIAHGQQAGAASGAASFQGPTKQVQIVDPVLQMKAYSFSIPANWVFEGAIMQGSPCSAGASPIFRMMSPDGITEVKMLPRFDWTWSDQPRPAAKPGQDCLPFTKEISAEDFLKYMVGVLGVTFVREDPLPNHAEMQENIRKQNQRAAASAPPGTPVFSSKGDNGRFVVRYNVNSIPVEEDISVTTLCSDAPLRTLQGVTHFYTCNAWVSRSRARQGQLAAARNTFKAINQTMVIDQQWNQRWMAVMRTKIDNMTAANGAAVRKMGDDNFRLMQARQNAFNEGQAMRQRQHEQFLATMQRGTDLSMKGAQDSMNARSRMADDWADYALDQQKRRDPTTGEITKDSSQYSYTWIDEAGHHFQTNGVNDNPNGRLQGNWTLQQNVR